jgi:hypothetical protein
VSSIDRVRPPQDGDELATQTALLDFLRDTVVMKVAGLTDEQAFSRPVSPSALTPARIVKHLTGVERFWFSIDFAGADLEWPWTEENSHGNFLLDPRDLAHLIEETARHLGHLDLLRESIDGVVGE